MTKSGLATDENIKTDVPGRSCEFQVAEGVDYKAKLTEIAKTNEHVKGYEIQ